jgi:hypothetical protein
MKKRTKKRILKGTSKVAKGLGKLLVIYPAKGLIWGGKKAYAKIKKIKHKQEIQKSKPKGQAKYAGLKEIRNKQGSLQNFENKLFSQKSTIGLILGARGSGKSAIGMRLLENFAVKTSKNIIALGFKPASVPKWIKVIKEINEIQNNSVLLIDEGGIEFSSRKTMSSANKLLSEILLIARHKDLSVMFITQNSSNLEINAIRQADYLILKPSSLLQKDFERKKIRDIYVESEYDFKELGENKQITYLYAENYRGFVANKLPSFWSDNVSKGYAGK